MNKKHLVRRIIKRSRVRALGAFCGVFVLAIFILAGLQQHSAFVSPEVHFADAVASGMQIVPASCPSNPGDADAPWGCDGSSALCADGSIAPNDDVTQCTCAQGNQAACTNQNPTAQCPSGYTESSAGTCVLTVYCPDGSAAPYADLNDCPDDCSSSLIQDPACLDQVCPDGSSAPGDNVNDCTCAQGNFNACTGSCPAVYAGVPLDCTPTGGPSGNPESGPPNTCPADYSGTYPKCTPDQGAPAACDMYFDPATVYQNDPSTLNWSADSAGTLYDVYGTSPEPASGSLGGITTSESTTYSFLANSGSYCYATLNVSQCVANQGDACTSAPNDCGLTDGTIQCDGSCGIPSDAQCNAGIVVAKWQLKPTLVQSGETTLVSWQVENAAQCTVTGSNGDSWSGPSGAQTSSPISAQTIYTLHCTSLPDALPATPVVETATVNITPGFEEQ